MPPASGPVITRPLFDGVSRIAFADDQNAMRSAIRRILEKERDFETHEFTNGNDLIEFIGKHSVDLVLTDIYMDKGSGFDVLRAVRNRVMASDVPVVFVSGEATKDDIVHAIDAGASDYLLKPFESADLVAKLRLLLDRYHNPSERDLELRNAESLFIQGNIEEAELAFTELQRKDPKVPRVLAGLAQCSMKLGRNEIAEKLLQAAAKVNGLFFPAYALMAELYLAQKDVERAKDALLKELSINGKQPHRRMILARLYDEEGSQDLAFEEMRRALMDSPKDEELLLYMADLHFRAKNEDKSIHYYIRARKNNPESMRALEGIMGVYWANGKPEKAHQLFKDMIRALPKQKDVLLVRSKLFEKEGNFADALSDVEAYLENDPDNLEIAKTQVRLLGKLGRHKDAIVPLRRILQNTPTAENYAKVALTYLKIQQPSTAARYYEQAVARAPEHVNYHFNLGYSYEISKAYDRAQAAYERVLTLAPDHADARAALERLKTYAAASSRSGTPSTDPASMRHFEVGDLERYPANGKGPAKGRG